LGGVSAAERDVNPLPRKNRTNSETERNTNMKLKMKSITSLVRKIPKGGGYVSLR